MKSLYVLFLTCSCAYGNAGMYVLGTNEKVLPRDDADIVPIQDSGLNSHRDVQLIIVEANEAGGDSKRSIPATIDFLCPDAQTPITQYVKQDLTSCCAFDIDAGGNDFELEQRQQACYYSYFGSAYTQPYSWCVACGDQSVWCLLNCNKVYPDYSCPSAHDTCVENCQVQWNGCSCWEAVLEMFGRYQYCGAHAVGNYTMPFPMPY